MTKKIIVLIILICHSSIFIGQRRYSQNSHVNIETRSLEYKYIIDYTFKNHWNELQELSVSLNKRKADSDIQKFGIPDSMFDRYVENKEVVDKRNAILKEGLYKRDGNTLVVDYSSLVNYFRNTFIPISDYLIEYLKSTRRDNRRNRIEIAMKFVQDIPYGLPYEKRVRSKYGGYKYDDGIFAPNEVLIKGYGDCDSKTFLFACIVSHMINPDDIIFVRGDNHILSAIKSTKISGGKYFKYEGGNYYICETAGPGRPMFGERKKKIGKATIYPLNL